MYKDVNVNLGNKDVDVTDADQGGADQQNVSQQSGFKQEGEDAHVTLTPVLDTQKTRADNEIASLMDTLAHHATSIPKIASSSTTANPPPPLFYNPLSQQATPTASETTTSLLALLNFAFVFKFIERVFNLEKDLSEMKSSSQPQSSYEAAATLSEFELTKILIDKMERNKSYDIVNHKRELYNALVKSYQIDKDLFDSYGKVFSLKRSRDNRDKDRDLSAGSD
ncbi:hypothetical protein Tco_1422187 [Tanacetum coccineum]